MKKLFYLGIIGFILFEIANVYFIMPMPGSQAMDSISLAYFLNKLRWAFRGLFGLMAVLGMKAAFSGTGWKKWLPAVPLVVPAFVFYQANFEMAADMMFYQPTHKMLATLAENKVDSSRLVLGVEYAGEAKAYPIQFLGYHHQVPDTIGGKPIIVTYCTVCRTGRVFEPLVNGQPETFRLVGMDHFNAMFEDKTTKSWWRQVNGEAVAGPLKGQALPEFPSIQTTLEKWSELYPNTLVMQPDVSFQEEYDSLANYEAGRRKGKLTRRDTASWQDKSWVIGVELDKASKAYDWNDLQKQRIVQDEIGGQPIVLALSQDSNSFVVLQRADIAQQFSLHNDTLKSGDLRFDFIGKSLQPSVPDLKRVRAYQEYWHSWRTFHPLTEQ
ncbi:MAG: DUF3179 domain-containing protein [Saprospiraceae bacterium]|nr:DUF3179 domain-containing protein [Saprospiraceae bacterium]